MITSAVGMPVNKDSHSSDLQLNVEKMDIEANFFKADAKTVDLSPKVFEPENRGNYAFNGLHPAIGISPSGAIVSSYYEFGVDAPIWCFSNDGGLSFDPGIYYDSGGDYPSLKHWGGDRFFGTYVCDYLDLNGGATHLMDIADPYDYDTYEMTYWDWSSYGWSDMIDADIACDNSQNEWEWGVSTYVISTTYGGGYNNGPTVVYSDEETEGSGWISWYDFNGSEHTDVDIDPVTHYVYAVYDWEDTDEGLWKILVRKMDFVEIMEGYDELFVIGGEGNLVKPAVAAYNDNLVILAETDQNGNKDIICLYSDAGDLENLQASFVADSAEDELDPDVRFDLEGNFYATYVEGNNLYSLKSEDGGATWVDYSRKQVNDNADSVVEEYKTSDIGDYASMAMWEEEGDETEEIWVGALGAVPNPPEDPTITGPTDLKPNKDYTYKISTTEPDGEQVYFYIDWGDGSTVDWDGPYNSDEEVSYQHRWTTKSTFTIKVKAKDTNDLESGFTTLKVCTPRTRMLPKLLDYFPNAFPFLRALFGL